MNIGEATNTQIVLAALFGREPVDEERLRRAAVELAERAHATLAAGPRSSSMCHSRVPGAGSAHE